MKNNPFESQLERLARTLTEQFGVKVICQGEEAWTDGRQIVLPSLPEPLDQKLERMVVGYLDHEMAHVAFSDFQFVGEFSQKHPGYEAMLNVVEDALIEKRAMQRWPGVRANLDAMFAQVKDRVMALAEQRDAFGKFCTAVYLKLAHYNDMLGLEAHVAGYENLLDGFATVQSTRDSAGLAEQLLTSWLANNPPQCQNNSNTNGGKGDGSSNQTNDGGSNANACHPEDPENRDGDVEDADLPDSSSINQTDGDTAQTEGSEQADKSKRARAATGGKDSEARSNVSRSDGANSSASSDSAAASPNAARACAGKQEAPEATNQASSSPNGAGGSSLVTQALVEAIAEQVAASTASGEYRVFTKQFDRIDVVPTANEREVRELLKKHVDVVRRLRRGLANALRSREKRWWKEDQIRGALSPRSLHRLCLDRPQLNVFRTKAVVQGRSTAVSIVLDASGSMTTNKMDVARDALRVLLQALSDLNVATDAFTFTTGNNTNICSLAQQGGKDLNDLRQRYSRISNLEIGLVKQFDEPVKAALRRLPGIRGTGLTPLGEAMQIGAMRLVPRRESRRIMLVLTDGRAGCESNDGAAVAHAQYVANQIEKAGIELVGVGILDESLRAIVADTIVVHELKDLAAQLCKLLSRTLLKGLRNVG